ncbi:peptidase M14 [Aliidiomarina taiwanensis]|uniref:Peptidase M14 n=2 Tax=Aliidiomarina taiwanensis TaxID=946228 RepID=A0A432XAM1_9GAMM|nr:peptidase M14 [Aliidiomarina taiwanensis]
MPMFASATVNQDLPQQYIPNWYNSTQYLSSTPTVEQVLGYAAGSRISSPAAIHHYFSALAQAHPDRIKLFEYGRTWEGRPLFYAAISSPENIARLEQLEANMRLLADPRQTSEAEAADMIKQQPASVWIASSVHGNEISPADSSMVTAWHLLAHQDEATNALLQDTVIYLDPLQNPDGRARFVSRYYATIGLEPAADRIAAEHNEPWPNGRTNHYLFDMNRDWLTLTQPETQGRVRVLQQTFPLLFVDSHEMGGDSPYYFTPEAHPYNPFITQPQREALHWVGEHNASHFDANGIDYYTREIFDAFYPGYGASWPLYHGTIAMTYEVGSSRGHTFRTRDGETLTYADTVQRNFIAYMATIETAQQRRQALLERFYQYRSEAVNAGNKGDVRSYIFANQRDAAGHRKLMSILTEHGIEVEQAQNDFRACRTRFPAGAYIVNANQPSYQLIRTLLDKHVPMDPEFLAEQERLRANNLPDQIYDVTAWSLPLQFNLDMQVCNRTVSTDTVKVAPQRIQPGTLSNPDARYGFFAAWGDMNTGRLLTAALRAGLLVRSADVAFTDKTGTQYPAGSLIIPREGNPEQLNDILTELAHSSGAHLVGSDSSWMQAGPNPGSNNVKRMHAPRIAMLWGEPSNVLSAGSTRFIIEREFNYPVTAIRAEQLKQANLSRYQVIILPATRGAGYQQALGASGREHLRQWVQNGGVLITLGNATAFATSGDNPLLASQLEMKAQVGDVVPKGQSAGALITDKQDLQRYIRPDKTRPDWVAGALLRAEVDQEHWLTAGIHSHLHSLYTGNAMYTPLRIEDGRNLVYFSDKEQVLASGHMWPESHEQVALKPLLMQQPHGRGMVVSFTQEPNYRAYMDGMHVLLMNAIFRASAHARPLR